MIETLNNFLSTYILINGRLFNNMNKPLQIYITNGRENSAYELFH